MRRMLDTYKKYCQQIGYVSCNGQDGYLNIHLEYMTQALTLGLFFLLGLSTACGDSLVIFDAEPTPPMSVSGVIDGLESDVSIPATLAILGNKNISEIDSEMLSSYVYEGAESLTVPVSVRLNQLRLRVGIMWFDAYDGNVVCLNYGARRDEPDRVVEPAFEAACRDPFDVIPAGVSRSVSIETEGDEAQFTFVLDENPLTYGRSYSDERPFFIREVMFGKRNRRIGVAGFILFLDGDGDGIFSFHREPRIIADGQVDEQNNPVDLILGASMASIDQPHTRLTFMEAGADPGGLFYPAPKCRPLAKPGFSVWKADGYQDPNGTCEDVSNDGVRFSALNIDERRRKNLSCYYNDNNFPEQSFDIIRNDSELINAQTVCLSPDELFVAFGSRCPSPRWFSLVGCYRQATCAEGQEPDYDLRDDPPELWPCGANE